MFIIIKVVFFNEKFKLKKLIQIIHAIVIHVYFCGDINILSN